MCRDADNDTKKYWSNVFTFCMRGTVSAACTLRALTGVGNVRIHLDEINCLAGGHAAQNT